MNALPVTSDYQIQKTWYTDEMRRLLDGVKSAELTRYLKVNYVVYKQGGWKAKFFTEDRNTVVWHSVTGFSNRAETEAEVKRIISDKYSTVQNLTAPVATYEAPATSPRLPLATPVRLSNGVEAVICDYAANDTQRYRVTWFNRHVWAVRYRWVSREQFEVIMEDEALEDVAGVAK